MLDHATKWTAAPDWSVAMLELKDTRVRSLALPEKAIVSGDLKAFGRETGLDPKGVGANGHAHGDTYSVRLARDRLMVVGDLPDTARAGWNDAGFAITLIGGGEHVFELSGPGVAGLLSLAMTLSPAEHSASAAVGFAGVPAVIYRHGSSGAHRLHVERGLAVYLWSWLQNVLGA
jgi:sarcosine oxidase gamma subunit